MKKYIVSILLAGFVAAFPVIQTGCQTAPSARVVEVQTLKAVGASAKAAIDASAQLLKQGQKIAAFYDTKFQPAFNLAVAAASSDLSSVASPDLINLATQLANLVAQLTAKPTT